MSEHHLAVSPLVRQAARNLRTVEWLSENNTWSYDSSYRWNFWRTWRTMAMTPDEAATWLPAVAVAVQWDAKTLVLDELTRWPIPEPLPPEALPWRDRLIQVWEQYRPVTDGGKTIRLAALVRLDRRVERLPEWLREARRARDLWWYDRDFRLAALAGWRPRPGDAPPHGDKAEAAQAWVRFWEKLYQHPGSQPDGLFAATALLHLASIRPLPDAGTGNRPAPCAVPAQLLPPHSGMRQPENPGCPALMLSSTHEQNARDLGFRAASPLPKVSATGTGLHR
jgi:hypothetical protein